MTLRTLKYGNYGIFLIMGNAGFCPSTVIIRIRLFRVLYWGPFFNGNSHIGLKRKGRFRFRVSGFWVWSAGV